MSNSNSPCAACKFLRRKCTLECVFAPYFPPDQPQKFANVHKVFGASNVAKILNELVAVQREDAVNSLAYEADARLRDPVYGCVAFISQLQYRLRKLQTDIYEARKELATYVGPSAMMPMIQSTAFLPPGNNPQQQAMMGYNMGPMMGLPPSAGVGGAGPSHGVGGGQMVIRDAQPLQQQPQHPHYNPVQHQQQQFLEQGQQLAAMAARDEREIMRNLQETQRQQQELIVRFNNGFDVGDGSGNGGVEFTPLNVSGTMSPSLALDQGPFDHPYQIQQPKQQQQQEPLLMLQQPSTSHYLHQPQQQHHHNLHQQLPHHVAEAVGEAVTSPQALQQQHTNQLTYQQQELALQPVHQPQQQSSGSEEGRTAGPSC